MLGRLVEIGVDRRGQVSLQPIDLILSAAGDAARRDVGGDGDDALIWDELVETTGEDAELTPTFLAFLVIACLLAAVGVITGSAVTIVGAMVVSPDFGPLAALAVAVLGRRPDLARRAVLALGVGFPLAIAATALCAALARVAGLLDPGDLTDLGDVAFVYRVGPYSVVVALLAGAAGMLALTRRKSGALVGGFISVTTVPAAGFAALAAVSGDWARCGEAVGQLAVNLAGVAVAGTVALWLRRRHVPPPTGRRVANRRGRAVAS